MRQDVDLLIAGGGPTGLGAAIDAAQRGLSVAVVEPHAGVIDKACGEGLMPGALRELDRLGVSLPRSHRFTGIAYVRDGASAWGDFPDGPGLGVRRTVLHAALSARAEALGVRRVTGRVEAVQQDGDGVTAAGLRARWMLAADGLRSPTRAALGLDVPTPWPRRYGLRRHYAVRPWSDRVEVHWCDDAEAYVTPVDDALVGVAFLYGDAARRADEGQPGTPFDRLLRRFPALSERLTHPATSPRGAGPFARRASARVAGRVLLIGDAAGYLDPLTGEGVKLGLRSARAALDAITTDQPASYESTWRALYRPYARATGALLLLTRPRWTRRLLVPVLNAVPPLLGTVLRQLGD